MHSSSSRVSTPSRCRWATTLRCLAWARIRTTFTGTRGVFCEQGDAAFDIGALNTFWRGAENFATQANYNWYAGGGNGMLWANSQAVSLRRVKVAGDLMLYQYIPPFEFAGYASGGYMASVEVDGTTYSGSQQQYFTRNCKITEWVDGVWNMVFVGTEGVDSSMNHCGAVPGEQAPITAIDQTPVISEKPFISVDTNGLYFLNVPDIRTNAVGPDFNPGTSIPFSEVYVAKNETDTALTINEKIAEGLDIVFSPGIYQLTLAIEVTRPGTVLLGLGLATLVSANGNSCIEVADVEGVRVAGLLLQAGPEAPDALLVWGDTKNPGNEANPGFVQDVYARVGGPDPSSAPVATEKMVQINSGHVIGDNLWLWRADHDVEGLVRAGRNPVQTGIEVVGDDVTMYGLFVEHTLRDQAIWSGERGRTYFFQCELPYDVAQDFGDGGFVGYRVVEGVSTHNAWGVGVYHFMRDHNVVIERGIQVPDALVANVVHPLSVFLDGFGEMVHVINDFGGNSSAGVEPGAVPSWYCDEAARAAGANSTTTIAAQQREDYML